MSMIGKEICDFKLQAYQDYDFKTVTKQDLLGKWNVLFLYPADFTFVCPTELADLGDLYPKFKEIGCEVYSLSADTHFVHMAWHESSELIGKITYPMLGDPRAVLIRDLDAYIEEDGLAERATFVINPEGKIAAYEFVAGNIGRNAEELLRRVQALQYVAEHGDEVCPAKWEPGDATLRPGIDLVGKL